MLKQGFSFLSPMYSSAFFSHSSSLMEAKVTRSAIQAREISLRTYANDCTVDSPKLPEVCFKERFGESVSTGSYGTNFSY